MHVCVRAKISESAEAIVQPTTIRFMVFFSTLQQSIKFIIPKILFLVRYLILNLKNGHMFWAHNL